MLKYLYIKDFIIFDEVSIDLENGFSAFTGETGAGKSIMVDAINLLCASRAGANLIAKGKESAVIEGVFDFAKSANVINILNEYDFSTDEDVIITRIIKKDGKSIARINHRMVNLSIVKEIMDAVLDIHSQHDTQYLLKSSHHINLLDKYKSNHELLNKVKDSYHAYKELKDELDRVLHEHYNVDDLEFYQYEINEINKANLIIGEDEEISKKEKAYLAVSKNLDKLNKAVAIFDNGLQDDFYELGKLLSDLQDNSLNDIHARIDNSYYEVVDAMEKIKDYLSNYEISEDEINALQERAFAINRLKRKYGFSIEKILSHRDMLTEKIAMINNRQDYVLKMENKVSEAKSLFEEYASELSNYRKEISKELDLEIMRHLKDLMLPNAQFKTLIGEGNENSLGVDKVEFLISMNPGEDLKPLVNVASGGELSRLMLGLKVIFSKLQGVETIIFDEIDSGVSGPVATAIGLKMKDLSKNVQVFSITHLAQVASCAKHHYHVSKSVVNNKTKTVVNKLNEDEKLQELAKIASGSVSEISLQAAKELYLKNQGTE